MSHLKGKSDVGNYYGFLKDYSSSRKPELSYFSKQWDIEQWKKIAREKVLELLNYFPEDAPFDAKTLKTYSVDGIKYEEIEFNTAKYVRIKGTVLLPDKGEKPYPAVIALHDHSGNYFYGKEKIVKQQNESGFLADFKLSSYEDRSWANELAKRGYAVMCIDGFYFGSRRLDLNEVSDEMLERFGAEFEGIEYGTDEYIQKFNKFCQEYEQLLVKHIFISGTTWPGILFHDDRKCIDYLYSRDDIDKDRIGCCGLSLGGFRSVHLAALDDRIKCSVAACWMSTYSSLLHSHLRNHTYMIYVPGITNFMDLPDIVSLTAPNPLFIQQCSKDRLFPLDGMEQACMNIQKVYTHMEQPEKYKYQFYDNGHEFNLQMQEDAFSWLDKWLKNENYK